MAKDRKHLSLNVGDTERKRVCDITINKEITQAEGAMKLGVSERQFRRILHVYREQGSIGLMHGLRGKDSNYTKDTEREKDIKTIISDPKYKGFGPTSLMEELGTMGIDVSDEWLRGYMMQNNLREGKKQKAMKCRQRRPRRPRLGEMIQYDGSYHHRLEDRLDEEFCLLVAIDDATSNIMYMKLGDNEGYKATTEFWIGYIHKHGVPESLYLDKFATYKVNNKKAENDKSMITNFEKSMRKLGCQLIKADSPQAKGRVERVNQTLQDRLVHKMRLAGICDIASANRYIEDIYIPRHNKKYSVEAEEKGDAHRQLSLDQISSLLRTCAIGESRVIQNDYVVTYKSKYFQLLPDKNTKVYTKQEAFVQRDIYENIQILVNDRVIPYKEIDADRLKRKRAVFWATQARKKETEMKERATVRQEERHIASKRRQEQYRKKSHITS